MIAGCPDLDVIHYSSLDETKNAVLEFFNKKYFFGIIVNTRFLQSMLYRFQLQ